MLFNNKKIQQTMPPEGWELIAPNLLQITNDMRDVMNKTITEVEKLLEILKLNYIRSKYVQELYKKRLISGDLYLYCLDNKWADKKLISK